MSLELNAASRLKIAADYTAPVKVEFSVTGDAKANVPKLLALLAFLGSAGASRTVIIEDVCASADGSVPEGNIRIGFDGDGPDKIMDLTVDGRRVTISDFKYYVSNE